LYSAAGRGIAGVSSAIEESDLYLYLLPLLSAITYSPKILSQNVRIDEKESAITVKR